MLEVGVTMMLITLWVGLLNASACGPKTSPSGAKGLTRATSESFLLPLGVQRFADLDSGGFC